MLKILLLSNIYRTFRKTPYFVLFLITLLSIPSTGISGKNIWALPLPGVESGSEPESEETPQTFFNQENEKQIANVSNNIDLYADTNMVRVSNNHALESNTGESSGCPPALFGANEKDGEAINYGNFISLLSGKGLKQWVSVEPSDLPVIAEGRVTEFELATNDVPINHNSHDIVWKIALDNPEYLHLAPDFQVSGEKEKELKMEWEIKNFNDPGIWPFEGDRAWILGRWIFDCGHIEPEEEDEEENAGHGEDGFKTEIHPPQAVAFTRDEPFIFSGNSYPSDAVKTFIFINGKGGYYNTNVGGENGNYAFDVDVPPKPSVNSVLKTQILFPDSGLLLPVLTSVLDSDGQSSCHISTKTTTECSKLHVSIPYSTISSSENNSYAAIVVAGWDEGKLGQIYREVQVTFDSIEVIKCIGCTHKDGEIPSSSSSLPSSPSTNNECISPDTRVMFAAVNGNYRILSGYGVDSPLLSSCDGQKIDLNIKFPPVLIKDDSSLKIRTTGYEENSIDNYFGCGDSKELYDHAGELRCLGVGWSLINPNTKLCDLKVDLTAADNFGIKSSVEDGTLLQHASCSNDEDEIKLTYHVDEVQKFS